MAEEIDEKAAVEFFEWVLGIRAVTNLHNEEAAARVALRWKARAEDFEAQCKALEGEIDRMRLHGVPCDCKDCR